MGAKRSKRRAWMLDVSGFSDSVVSANSRGQAIAIALRALHRAGYKSYRFTDIRCARTPKHDAWAVVDATRTLWNPDLLPASAMQMTDDPPRPRGAFTFIEILFAVIIMGIGLVMLLGVFSAAMIGTGAIMTDTRVEQVLKDAHQAIQAQAWTPGTSALLPGQINSKFMPILTPLPQSFASRLGDQIIPSGQRYGWVAFYRRDSITNPFAQVFVIALRNENFPLYSKPIPIPPSIYGGSQPSVPTIAGTLAFDPASGTSSISFASTVLNAAQGAFALIADDGTDPQPTTWTDPSGVVHHGLIYNNAPLTGRFLKLGNQLASSSGSIIFQLEPGHDLTANDWTLLTTDGNVTGQVMLFLIGRAPLPNSAAGDFSGPFNGPNQDIGANSSFAAIGRSNH